MKTEWKLSTNKIVTCTTNSSQLRAKKNEAFQHKRNKITFLSPKHKGRGNCSFEITLKCRIIIYLRLEINFRVFSCKKLCCAANSRPVNRTYLLYIFLCYPKKPFNLVSFNLLSVSLAPTNAHVTEMCVESERALTKTKRAEIRLWLEKWNMKEHKKSAFHVEYLFCVHFLLALLIRWLFRVNIENSFFPPLFISFIR